MSDEQTPQNEAESLKAETPAADAPQSDAERDAAAVQALIAENASLKDKVLRTLAEMENLRRRTEKEVTDAKIYGVASFARDMLTFADNLHRSLDNVPAEARESDPALKTFIEGIELTERDFISRLQRHGVRKLDPKGQKFDPNFHEALFEIPDESIPTGTVAQVVEDGFAIGERVLRPAKVGVARGGPKA
ncbi:nucleotide exchange factor GrpE [Rhodoblastus sphagnicola]|uniref:Protein GrpE n=1 Tax=Rhodoblastus sphagnicola TaxID=333368 RepID=A0A2S6N5F4_9HYPH|nr:nucleotide exchange factor GrpE [Rhodoblastus sphagnicola]MBB4197236.1 molecular chaperone GrpE [Rhodoblastus sphagnicola]PPQ29844.1 nucleotide exchange factor GrpE [Rhodoblastus sphagnicola]